MQKSIAKTEAKVKVLLTLITLNLPFILVWMAYIMTGFSFSVSEVFLSGAFWGGSVIYWVVFSIAAVAAIWDN